MIRKFAIGLAALLGLAVAAAWIVPPLLDWSRYRDTIAVLASAVLGRPVSIAGPVSLTLLPEAVLTASDVTVGGVETGGRSDLAGTARALRLRVGLMPLLTGTVAARELVLRSPDIRVAWPLSPGVLAATRPTWLASVSARIEKGTLTVGDFVCTDIDASFSAGGDSAGATAAGMAHCERRDWRFTARATGVGPDGSEGLDVTLDGQGAGLGLGGAFSGQLASDGTLSGQLTARGPDLSQILPAPSVPFRAAGRLTLAAGLAAADDLAVEIGGSPAHAAVTLRVAPAARLDVALAASRLDLDAWLPVLLRQTGFPWPVGLDLSAEAVNLRGGLLRRVRADFAFAADGTARVSDVAAILPGDADLHLRGAISRAAAGPRFSGDASVAAPDLRSTLRWLSDSGLHTLAILPTDVLRRADLVAAVAAESGHLALTDLRGEVDGTKLTGELGLGVGDGLAVAGRLTMDRLALDPWLAGPLPDLSEVADRFAGLNADLQLTSAAASWHGLDFHDVSLDASVASGRVAIRHLAAVAQGVAAQLSGAIVDGGRIADGRLTLSASDASPLARLAPAPLQQKAFWQVPCRLEVQAAGPPEALGLRIGLDLGDARLEAQPVLDLGARRWAGPVTLRHPGATRLLQLLGIAHAGWLGDGSLALVTLLSGAPGHIAADKIELGAGAFRGGGQLALEEGPTPRLSGRIDAETLPLPGIDVLADDPLPLAALRGWQAALDVSAGHVVTPSGAVLDASSGHLSVTDGTLRLDQFSAVPALRRLAGGRLTGSLGLDTAADPPRLTAQLHLADAAIVEPLTGLPLDIAAGRLAGDLTLAAAGHSEATFLATLAGRIGLSAVHGAVSGFDLSQAADALARDPSDTLLRQALGGGSTGYDSLALTAVVLHGDVTLQGAQVAGPSGNAAVTGDVDIAGAALDLHALLQPALPDAPALGLRIVGPWAAPQRIPELADVTRWRSLQAAK